MVFVRLGDRVLVFTSTSRRSVRAKGNRLLAVHSNQLESPLKISSGKRDGCGGACGAIL